MLSQEYFTHYPTRLLSAGGGLLCVLLIVSASLLIPLVDQPSFPLPPRISDVAMEVEPLSFLLDGRDQQMVWELSTIENELMISLSPPRPSQAQEQNVGYVRLKNSQQTRRITFPTRLYLSFNDRGVLGFQENPGPFWADLSQDNDQTIRVQLALAKNSGEIQQHVFARRPDILPIQKSEEFPAGSPLRILADARWYGVDLVAQMNSSESKQRLEIGSVGCTLGPNDWLAWKGGQWVKVPDPSMDLPLARIRSISGPMLEFDVWESSYARIGVPLQTIGAAHVKTDEWITSLRIRSDRQLSCALEKQPIILRLGDWVLKENNRWRVLHKAEEKQQVLDGNKMGDLFILEKIDAKQRLIKGKMFLANRTQTISIEAAANARSQKHFQRARHKGKI